MGIIILFTSYYFDGQLDEVAIWNKALSATEVAALSTANAPANLMALSAKPIAYYSLGEFAGNSGEKGNSPISGQTNSWKFPNQAIKDYVFDRVLYWKLENSHNVVINRDREWFERVQPTYKEVWEKVLHLRDNPKDALKFKEDLTKSKRTTTTQKANKNIKSNDSKEDLFVTSDSDSEVKSEKKKFVKKKFTIKKKIDDNLFVNSDSD